MMRWTFWATLVSVVVLQNHFTPPACAQAPLVTRVLERIPRTAQELAEAHDKSDLICTMLEEGVPLAQPTFSERTVVDVDVVRGGVRSRQQAQLNFGRWPVIDYGTLMIDEDRKQLPFFTSGVILDVIDNTYISLQARVQRASPDGEPYLYYVPAACAGEYGKPATASEFAALQQSAVSNVHGLGLFVKPGQPRNPQALRTLVISIKGSRIIPNKELEVIETVPTMELLFVRMRIAPPAKGQAPSAADVRVHAFGTIDGLTKLVSFAPYTVPKNVNDCTIRSTVRITEYALAGQLPSARAAREVRVQTDKEFAIADLNAYVRRAGMPGDAFDNLTELLDAIIDGQLR